MKILIILTTLIFLINKILYKKMNKIMGILIKELNNHYKE
jgi:hypothetical protein